MHPFRTVVPLVLAAFSIEANAAVFEVKSSNYTSRLSRLNPGDTLRLTGGTYPGLVVRGLHGTRDAWITITGPESGSPARIVGSACCNTVEISNSSFIIIRNFTIDSRGIDGAFGISAKDGLNNLTHHVIIQNNTLVGQNGSQQTVGISTKSPTWAWIIRNNKIIGAGTGIYLGDSDGRMPFVAGIIENNLIMNTIGYNIEIKWQRLRPDVKGMVTTPQSTIIRNNVFIKDDQPSPDGDRPNVLVGGFPESGPGSTDIYEVYGNFFFHNPREALFQGSGRVSLHDNIFVGGDDAAIVLQAQDLPLKLAHVYNNTVYAEKQGIVFGSPAKLEDSVIGNLVLASLPFSGPIVHAAENLTDRIVNAGSYVRSPSFRLGEMDFYPLANKCRGAPLDLSAFGPDTDYTKDFNGIAKDSRGQGIVFRGAYAGEGVNPGWMLAPAFKSVSAGQSPLALELFPSTLKRRFDAQARLTGAPGGRWFDWGRRLMAITQFLQ